MRYPAISQEFFAMNRKRFMRQMRQESLAIFQSNDLMPRNGDQFFPYRQNSDLFYLSGIEQEESILVLFPECPKDGFEEVLFIRRNTPHLSVWEGEKLSIEKAREISGIPKVFYLDEMEGILQELVLLARRIYLNSNENDRYQSDVPSRDSRFNRYMMDKYPFHKYHRSQPILKNLRMIKSGAEIELIRTACEITGKAFRRVLEYVKPGVFEYEVEAEIIHEFIRNRATGHAYSPIIATGSNACTLHYQKNSSLCAQGQLLLLDFGAEYANYAADLTRTIPVSGQFTERQRKVYDAVHRVLEHATAILVPGTTLEEYHKEVGRWMESELLGLGLIDHADIKNQDPAWPAYKKYFMHGTSHHLGLDVHDLSNRYDPIQEGMVFTVEPGIYIPEEGIGIRLENNVLVTDREPVNFMEQIPLEAEEIEEIMGSVHILL